MKHIQRGFTLIELMIVVAIVGILAAVALPAYQNYVIRSKLSEVILAMDACKTGVSDYFNATGNVPADVASAGCSTTPTQYLAGMTVGPNGHVNGQVQPSLIPGGCTLTLSPQAAGSPNITAWAGSTTCPKQYVPAVFQ